MRGKVTFEAAGQDYALRFTTNRLCQLEEDTGEKVLALCAKMDNPGEISFIDLRRMFRAGLEGDFSEEQAGDILDDVGKAKGLLLVAKAMEAAFDVGKPGEDKPGKPKAGAV